MFTRLAINVNCDHNWFNSAYGPPNQGISINDDTFAATGNVASGASESSTIKSSVKGYSRSRTTRRPRRMRFLWRSSSLSVKGVSLKVQCPPARCLQSQSLVTGKVVDTLEASQDFIWAVSQNQNVFAVDKASEVVRFASCICGSSDEKSTNFIGSPNLLHFVRAL